MIENLADGLSMIFDLVAGTGFVIRYLTLTIPATMALSVSESPQYVAKDIQAYRCDARCWKVEQNS